MNNDNNRIKKRLHYYKEEEGFLYTRKLIKPAFLQKLFKLDKKNKKRIINNKVCMLKNNSFLLSNL